MLRRPVLALLTAALVATGCSAAPGTTSEGSGASTTTREPAPLRYVALGDSYTAAPLVPSIDGASGPCLRSTANYPALVAEAVTGAGREVRLRDRSCVEARTADLFAAQTSFGQQSLEATVPPQTRPLGRRTDLVTVGVGGNDVLGSVVGTCPDLRDTDPTGSPCADALGSEPFDRLADLEGTLADALRRVARQAPRADVLVVGYPQTAPPSGTCGDLLPLADGDVAFARAVADGLDDALRGAASAAGVEFVDAYAASAGHDICAPDPWVNGATTDPGAALAFHPFAAGQEAVAELVVQAARAAESGSG